MKVLKFIFIGVLAMFLSSCVNQSKSTQINKKEGLSFKLSLVKVIYENKEYLANENAYMEFSKDGVNGSSGCNRFFGKANYENDIVIFDNVGSTKMYCHNYNFEYKFFQSLTKLTIANHTDKDGNIMLYNDKFVIVAKPLD